MKSDDIKDLAMALSNFQGECPAPALNVEVDYPLKTGGRKRFKYADLLSIRTTIAPHLKKNGLSFSQIKEGAELVTYIMHSSGQWLCSRWALKNIGSPQEQGSELTYAKRYSLCAILGIVGDEDEDGALASEKKDTKEPPDGAFTAPQSPDPEELFPAFDSLPEKPKANPIAPKKPSPVASSGSPSEKQIARLWAIANKNKWSSEAVHAYIARKFKIDSVLKLTQPNYQALCDVIIASPINV
jgi:hypothetical protein